MTGPKDIKWVRVQLRDLGFGTFGCFANHLAGIWLGLRLFLSVMFGFKLIHAHVNMCIVYLFLRSLNPCVALAIVVCADLAPSCYKKFIDRIYVLRQTHNMCLLLLWPTQTKRNAAESVGIVPCICPNNLLLLSI